jgi:RNA polymerase sigma factor (sigma-70 family)
MNAELCRILNRFCRVVYLSHMSGRAVQSLKQYLRRVSDEAALQADALLLRQFTEASDHQAFEALLDRHGPMVLGTARRLVANATDADDVFQAVFLSLARLAKTIRHGQSVPNWLYKSTCRIAARARKRRAVSIEHAPEPSTATTAETELVWREVRTALDDELQRLPERLRSPLLLCYLSGLTRDEAAQQLGWSLSTLKRRLDEGRTALRRRLERRGISAAGLALAVLSPAALDAEVRPALAQSCLDTVAGKETAAGVSALLLTSTTTFTSLAMKAVIVSLALVGLGIGVYASFGRADPPKPVEEKKTTEPPAAAKRVDSLGDPLPDGAIMRLGTRRYRAHLYHPALPFQWLYRPDGKSYLVRHSNVTASEIRRIDAKSGVVVESWPIPKSLGDLAWASQDDEVVGFSPDGRYVLLTNEYIHHGLVEMPQEWHLNSYDLIERKAVWCISKKLESKDWPDMGQCVFSTNNKWFVTGGPNGRGVRLWDARTGEQLWEHRSKGQSLSPIGFVDNGDTVVLRGDNDGSIYLFDRAKGTERKSFPTAAPQSWGQNLLSPDGKHVVICTLQPPSIWDLDGKKVAVLEGHKKWANGAAFSPDGKKLFTGCFDSFVIEREWPSGKPIRKIELGRDRVMRMAVSPDGKRLEVVFEGEHALIFYDLETGKQLPEPIDSHRSTVYGVECTPDGSLISFGADRSVHTWDLKQGKSVAQIAVDLDMNGRGFALSADGTRIAVPNDDVKSIGIYERKTGKRLRNTPADRVSNLHLAFSPDGRFLAAIAKSDRSAQVWDADTGAPLLKVRADGDGNTITGTFSADGRTFAVAGGGQIRMWDTATWKEGIGIQAPLDWAWPGAFGLDYSPDGRMFATARTDGVRLYEVATRRERAHVQVAGSTSGMLRFSHNGRLLAWVNDDSKIHVLDVRTGVLTGPFKGHDGVITGLAFTIDDKALASSSGDCTILIWDVSAKTVAKKAPDGKSDEDWQALRGEDAQKAFTAIRRLAADPETALKTANEHLKPAKPIDSQWVAARLRDLDSQKFAERDRATRELEECGDNVAAAVEKLLATKPSAEARQRAEKILAKIRGRDATDQAAQFLRALEVLEWLGTAKARELVEKLAKGAEGVSFTEEAKRSLKRWRASAE